MSKIKSRILVVDDNQGIRAALKLLLEMHFAEVELIASPNILMETMHRFKPDCVLLDMNFSSERNTGNEGLLWISELRKNCPDTNVVLFTAYADVQLAVEGMKRGAFDFIVKPWNNDKLVSTLKDACTKNRTKSTIHEKMFWGDSIQMTNIRNMVSKIAPTDATILITGENGTGKDMMAREIHDMSLRNGRDMIAVDAGAIPENLFESELFGYVKGAFTDAVTDHTGKFEQADGSTLFLDEIGNIPLQAQAKLLRVLQNRTVTRLGSSKEIPVNIRLLCATNMNLLQKVKEGLFREDLYYRLNTISIHIPALRERPEDIIPLANIFLTRYAGKYHRNLNSLSLSAENVLKKGVWKGNIRELQNCIEKAVILSEGDQLTADDFSIKNDHEISSHLNTLDEVEERTILNAMDEFHGNLSLVAKSLGISRPTLYNKLKKYGI